MGDLPDDLWRKILENTKLTYKDLCSISITCKRLHRLSGENSLWSHLLFYHFPWTFYYTSPFYYSLLQELTTSISAKSQYRIRLEIARERERKQERWISALLVHERPFAEFYSDYFEFINRLLLKKQEFLERQVQRMAVLEQRNLFDILSAEIQEIELGKEKKTRKPTVADLFNSTKANSKGFERVPEKRYPRERRSKAFTQRTKSWHR